MQRRSPKKYNRVPVWNIPSGLQKIWKLWKYCLCRNGFYPLVVAPFVTAVFVLDIYTSAGCRFMHFNVDYAPSTSVWNVNEVDLGFFYYRDTTKFSLTPSRTTPWKFLHSSECKAYDSSSLMKFFTHGDKMWKLSQVLAIISGGAGLLGTILIWMMIVTPLPTCFLWSGILLPTIMIEMLICFTKFLIFDAEICHDKLWIPEQWSANNTEGEEQKQGHIITGSCFMTKDSIVNLITIMLSFITTVLICMRVPKRRCLKDERYNSYPVAHQTRKPESLGDLSNHKNNMASSTNGTTRTPKHHNTIMLGVISPCNQQPNQISFSDLETSTYSFDDDDCDTKTDTIDSHQSCSAKECFRLSFD